MNNRAGQRPRNLPASVHDRLLNLAHSRREELQTVLTRYAVERLLYRLSRSNAKERFVLKGAVLFYLWEGDLHRPTRDVDFLGFGDPTIASVTEELRGVCTTVVEDDGLVFLGETIRAQEIREQQDYGGIRVMLTARLGGARIPVQIDVGFGDAIVPGIESATFPTLLDFPAPDLRVYPPETVVAEKLQAMISLGLFNTRMKDFYDLFVLSNRHAFDGATLASAIKATFTRRQTSLPAAVPVTLTAAFAEDAEKQTQWRAFLGRTRLDDAPNDLSELIDSLREFLWPPTAAAANGSAFGSSWLPEIGWTR
jgi:predicted nucleotidyltransferase component of viral defense system